MEYFDPIMNWLMKYGWPHTALLFGAVLPPSSSAPGAELSPSSSPWRGSSSITQ